MNKEYYQEYYRMEREHWWFLARAKILETIISRLIEPEKELKILNVGIATGASSEWLSKFGHVTSLEFDTDCCQFVSEKLNMSVIQGSITDLPFESSCFDLVCAFDVIEHVENDKRASEELNRVLKIGGHVFATVPAFQTLWSEHDEINHHYRRYRKNQFNNLFFAIPKLKLIKSSYFNSLMFLPIFLIRLISKIFTNKSKKENSVQQSDFERYKINKTINSLLYHFFFSERFILKNGLSFPFGVSILSIFRKTN
jgi:SAM-dependent methyltransferase